MESLDQSSGGVAPLALLFLFCMIILTWLLPRRLALIPLMITTCYMPLGQMFVIAGLNFHFFRILLLAGWLRVWMRKETAGFTFCRLDRLFVCWALVTLIVGTLTAPSMDRFISRAGEFYNAAGTYFLIRCWVTDFDEVIDFTRIMGIVVVPLALSMIIEKSTGRNVFSIFGGVPEFTAVREGRLRCQGAFRHPILAGTYAATLFPWFVALWFQQVATNCSLFSGELVL